MIRASTKLALATSKLTLATSQHSVWDYQSKHSEQALVSGTGQAVTQGNRAIGPYRDMGGTPWDPIPLHGSRPKYTKYIGLGGNIHPILRYQPLPTLHLSGLGFVHWSRPKYKVSPFFV